MKVLIVSAAMAVGILAPFAQSAEPTPAPLQLKGTQIQKTLTLVRAKTPHIVTGEYAVPEGSELTLEAGTEIAFAKDAGLTIRGVLQIKGTEAAPVILAGKVTGTAAWQGLRINKSPSTVITFVRITGAQIAIYVNASKPTIENAILTANTVGLHAGEYGSGSHPNLTNCLITRNKDDGIVLVGSSATLDHCTIFRNGGWGIRGEYYASPTITWSSITENKKGGVWCRLYTCKAEAHNCVFLKNANCDVFNDSPEQWDFSGNWWGSAATQLLQKKGDTANLQSIRDGRDPGTTGLGEVRVFGFLEKEPNKCGSTRTLKVN